jgi:hypothetical protein
MSKNDAFYGFNHRKLWDARVGEGVMYLRELVLAVHDPFSRIFFYQFFKSYPNVLIIQSGQDGSGGSSAAREMIYGGQI